MTNLTNTEHELETLYENARTSSGFDASYLARLNLYDTSSMTLAVETLKTVLEASRTDENLSKDQKEQIRHAIEVIVSPYAKRKFIELEGIDKDIDIEEKVRGDYEVGDLSND